MRTNQAAAPSCVTIFKIEVRFACTGYSNHFPPPRKQIFSVAEYQMFILQLHTTTKIYFIISSS